MWRALTLGLLMTTLPRANAGDAAPAAHAETLFAHGNIYTLDPHRPRAEALAVSQGRILAVGSRAEIERYRDPATEVIDLEGATVLPGLIDAHAHMAGLGSYALGRLDLHGARSFDDVIAAVRARVARARAGEWILGGRWDHESWPDRRLPTHTRLSEVSPQNPVWLTRVDGHAGIANAAAMKRAGITRETPDPPGGDIVRDEHGEPTGVFLDNAMSLIERVIDQPPVDFAQLVLEAQKICLSVGLTGVHDAGVSPAEIEVYRRLEAEGKLKLRIYAMVNGQQAIEYFRTHEPYRGAHLVVRSCKLYADGAMGSRGAWLLEPYSDRPLNDQGQPNVGLNVMEPEFIAQVAADAVRRGYQVCTHAIGDRANREVLEIYARALRGRERSDHRWRIEHAQLVSLADIPRFARLGVIASMQPTHCTSDMRWLYARIGRERARGAYAWAKLLRSGAVLALGSDFPVESPNPFYGLYAAVTRQDRNGQPPGGFQPQDCLTRTEALRGFALGAAYAAFEEDRLGSLTPGKFADFIVIDRDVMTCEAAKIDDAVVLRTVIGGQTVYRATSGR